MADAAPVQPEPDAPLARRHRVRLLAFALAAVAVAALLYVGQDFLATLDRLDVVERERDTWQRPDDILRALELRDGSVVADLGCGSGYFALKLSPAVGLRGRVLALDVRRLPLLFLRVRTWRRGLANVRVTRVRPDDPGLLVGGVDAVLVLNTLHELENAPTVLAAVRRALRPGGRVVVIDRAPRAPGPEAPGDHELTAAEGEARLRAAAFDVIARDDAFVDRSADPDVWWMIVARRP